MWPNLKLQASLGIFPGSPNAYLLLPMGSIPTGVWGLPGHLEETSDQAPAWPAALQVPQGVSRRRARGQGNLLEGGHGAPFLSRTSAQQLGGRAAGETEEAGLRAEPWREAGRPRGCSASGQHSLPPPEAPTPCLTCVCGGDRSSFFFEHFGINVPEVSWGYGGRRETGTEGDKPTWPITLQ